MARTNFGLGNMGLPSNLYSGGAVVLNSEPYTQYYLNQVARQKAQEDSMYRYFGEMGKNLTPAGMDGKDIPGLMQRKNEWQQYMMENRKAIARPTLDQGKAYGEAMGRYNDMLSYINQSKSKVKNLAGLRPILNSPQKKALLNDGTLLRIQAGSLPLDDPHYQEFDPSAINYNAAPFDIKQANSLRTLIGQYKPSEDNPTITPLGNHQQQITHNFKFNQNQLQGIYGLGASQYHTNPSFQSMIDNVQNDPNMYHSLNETFKNHYGRDMYSGEDAGVAYMLGLHPDIANKTEIRNIPISPWESAEASLGREKSMYDYRQQQGGIVSNNAEGFLSDMENKAKSSAALPYIHKESGRSENAHDVPFTSDQMKKMFARKSWDGKETLVPDKVQVLDSGDYLPIFYQYDKSTGKPKMGSSGNIAVDERYTKPVARDAVKASVISNRIVSKNTSVPQKTEIKSGQTSKVPEIPKKQTFGTGGLN